MSEQRLAVDGGTPVRTAPFGPTHDYGEEELAQLTEMIRANDVGRAKTLEFERLFAERHAVHHAITCISGTAAMHMCVAAINPEPGDEFITTPLTAGGTFLGVVMQNAVPVFADVDPDTWCLDPQSVEAHITPRTRGIIPVHLFGNPCDMTAYRDIARRHRIALLEDCCQSHYAEYQGERVGSMGLMAGFSFGGKHMSAGGGGIVLTDDEALARRARMFHDAALPRDGGPYANMFLATNYKMPGVVAAVLIGQMEKLEGYVTRKIRAAEQLTHLLADIEEIRPQKVRPGDRHTYWVYGFRLDVDRLGIEVEQFAEAVKAEGITDITAPYGGTRGYGPLYRIPMLTEPACYGHSRFPFDYQRPEPVDYRQVSLSQAEALYRESVALGMRPSFSEQDVEEIATAIRKVVTVYLRRRAPSLARH
jgi:perosamine synthetase